MELAIVNLSGDLAHPNLLGILHAYDADLEVELEISEFDEDAWFAAEPIAEDVPLSGHGILREALRFLVRRRRDER